MGVPTRADLAGIPDYIIPGRPPGAILLNSNENSLPPLPAVVEAVAAAAAGGNRYPQWFSEDLVARLSAELGFPESWVGIGCGSVSLCQQLIQAYCAPGDEVLCAWRSFEAYPVFARVAGVRARTVPLDSGHRHDLAAMADALSPATRLVFVCNPNNPTGTAVGAGELRTFLERVPSDVLVVLDEAYREFVTDPDVPDGLLLARAHENVAVLRTFSKAYGLAGIRVGYCVGSPDVVAAVNKVAVPFAVSGPAQAAATAALSHTAEVNERCRAVAAERERVRDRLTAAGLSVPASQANFLWLPLGDRSADFAGFCENNGVLVRRFGDEGVRVTVGAREDNDVFVRAAEAYASAG
ncbi:aminotransferase [Streptomyces viridochromogenes]|uniref:Aromatic amino acid aminotransferase n=1 Tax=Streptomyces viridochromogenes TaxID=1938 RepID=A0A0J7Z7S6_STRVR|nr:histidinol-phosphate transaminase [Streptomyces viridochromogenes]KMS71537.1 aminotransferase [Streptomyces viridochromogenes]KOG11178.1 aminotransferase [Streptomyces viridochromogenes]KOG11318.1 aminotransferase [Streptomyces viridochromogenes]